MYTVFVAADCNGEKLNLQFTFDIGPSVAQVLNRASEAFRLVFLQRNIKRLFTVSASVIFNDSTSTWDRLERSTQLSHNCQIYVFQPDILDVPAEIGDPIPASVFLIDYKSPPREDFHPSPRPSMPSSFEARPTGYSYSSPVVPSTYNRSAYAGVEGSPNPYSLSYSSRYHPSSGPELSASSDSILRQEREKIERQSHLSLDQMREELRKEAKEFSASPDRNAR